MKNPFDHPAWIDISLLLGRASLGVYFLLSGWSKMTGPGLGGFVNGPFKNMKPAWLPDTVATPYGYALPVLELVCGLALALGLLSRSAAGVILLMLISFTVALVLQSGDATGGQKPGPFHTNIILAALALILMITGPGRLALDPLYAAPAGPAPKGK